MAIVKSDAYGHGAVAISNFCVNNGCDYLGVGDSSEALELRDSGISAPILVLGAVIEEELPYLISNGVELGVHSKGLLQLINDEARKQDRRARVHLKVDTGLARFGVSVQSCEEVLQAILSFPCLKLAGVFSHFSSAYSDPETTREQIRIFTDITRRVARKYRLKDVLFHIANSGGAISYKNSVFDMVRSGGGLYGLTGNSELPQILALKTQIAYIKKIYKNSPVGYDGTYTCDRDTFIGICPVGYNDGIPTCYSNAFEAIIGGTKVKLLGKVAMDYVTFDITDVRNFHVGQEVTIYDRSPSNNIYALARKFNLNRYELTCKLSKRVKRTYFDYDRPLVKKLVESEGDYSARDGEASRIQSAAPAAPRRRQGR